MSKLEKSLIEFVRKHVAALGVGALMVLSLAVRWLLMSYQSKDVIGFLYPWYLAFRENGGLGVLRMPIGDYNYLYRFLFALCSYIPDPMIAIKSLSLAFDYVGAAAGGFLVWTLLDSAGARRDKARFWGVVTALVLLFYPPVLLNAAVWGQCDMMYFSCLLFSLAYFWRERYIPAFVWYGLAFSFKLQAVFLLPLLLIFYLYCKNFSILHFLLVPAVLLATSLPVVAFRWQEVGAKALLEPFTVYFDQTQTYPSMSLNYPNIHGFLREMLGEYTPYYTDLYQYGYRQAIAYTLAVLGAAAIYILYRRYRVDEEGFLLLSIFSIFTCVMFLPAMHERYGFGVTILFLLYLILYRKLGWWFFVYLMIECFNYMIFLTDYPVEAPFLVMSGVNIAVYARLTWQLFWQLSHTAVSDEPTEKNVSPSAKRPGRG